MNNQIANLRAAVATLKAGRRPWSWPGPTSNGAKSCVPSGGISKEELDQRRQTFKVDQAAVDQAREQVYAIRVGLGLPPEPTKGHDLTDVPPDLDQNLLRRPPGAGRTAAERSAVRVTCLASWDATPETGP